MRIIFYNNNDDFAEEFKKSKDKTLFFQRGLWKGKVFFISENKFNWTYMFNCEEIDDLIDNKIDIPFQYISLHKIRGEEILK